MPLTVCAGTCAVMSAYFLHENECVYNVLFRATDYIIHVLCNCQDNQSTDELGPTVICLNVY